MLFCIFNSCTYISIILTFVEQTNSWITMRRRKCMYFFSTTQSYISMDDNEKHVHNHVWQWVARFTRASTWWVQGWENYLRQNIWVPLQVHQVSFKDKIIKRFLSPVYACISIVICVFLGVACWIRQADSPLKERINCLSCTHLLKLPRREIRDVLCNVGQIHER